MKQKVITAFIFALFFGQIMNIRAKSLGLVTEPAYENIEGAASNRTVIIPGGTSVTFSISSESKSTLSGNGAYLKWEFENGIPNKPTGVDAKVITYGTNAVGKENMVKFSTYREDDGECKTDDKVTCSVIVPKITVEEASLTANTTRDSTMSLLFKAKPLGKLCLRLPHITPKTALMFDLFRP
jgi:hypothetical protein